MRFRLVTYNIHKGIGGVDRRYRPQRIIDTLAHYNADVIFLQEVDDGVPRSSADRQVDLFGDALGLPHRAFHHNVKLTQGVYGNAILSRYPLHDQHNLDLTLRYKKPRGALMASCVVRAQHQRTIHLVNCHLGLAGFERRTQLLRILRSDALSALHRSTPLIVAGDYNDVWGTLGKRIMEPAGFVPACKAVKTFPAIMPLRALDRIYFQGDIAFDHSFPARTDIARQASDHLPIVADFELQV
jgi:endonuclease/exonuclease/phosphatase family metal-dependent hydrolase